MKFFTNSLKRLKLGREISRYLLIVILALIIHGLIYYSGGTVSAFPQLNFLPIFLSSIFWGIRGSLTVAVLLGIFTGPFCPLDVVAGIPQSTENWVFRLAIYVIVGCTLGYLLERNRAAESRLRENDLKDSFTGLGNINKLIPMLHEKMSSDASFYLVIIKAENLDSIYKYLDVDDVMDIQKVIISKISAYFDSNTIYSVNHYEYGLIMENTEKKLLMESINEFFSEQFESVCVGDYTFNLILHAGIVNYRDRNYNMTELLNKARIALDAGDVSKSEVCFYDEKVEIENKLYYEISNTLLHSLDNREFYTVLQPIVDLNKNEIVNAEVLLRWDRGSREPIGPGIFIDVAEQTGLIKYLSMFVLDEAISHLGNFKDNGISIRLSINVTSNELSDPKMYRLFEEIVNKTDVNPVDICYEITERVVSRDISRLKMIMTAGIAHDFTFEIDDFGTGYNSVMVLFDLPVQVIKIDKCCIDLIETDRGRMIIEEIIQLVHMLGGTVIAEGVETREQFLILKEIDCDQIQGYYFSKPLRQGEFVEYCKKFDMNNYL